MLSDQGTQRLPCFVWVNAIWRWMARLARNRVFATLFAMGLVGMILILNSNMSLKSKWTQDKQTDKNQLASTNGNPSKLVMQTTIEEKNITNNNSALNAIKLKIKVVEKLTKEVEDDSQTYYPFEARTEETPPKIKKLGDFVDNYKFLKNHASICGPNQGKDIPLLIIVTTAVNKIDSRDVVRNTWGGYAKSKGAKLIFLIGKTNISDVQDFVNDEDEFYKDIIQANFMDSYNNLTLKSVSLMKWVSDNCGQLRYALKADDDIVMNVDMLMAFVKSRKNDTKSIFGKVAKNWKPHRDKVNKWHVSEEDFNGTYYPDFTTGPAYLFTGDCAKLLYEGSLSQPFLFLEDVLLTGIVAQQVGIKRFHHPKMKNIKLKVTYCLFKRFMTSHRHTPEEITDLWEEVNRTNVNCTAVKKTVVKTAKKKT